MRNYIYLSILCICLSILGIANSKEHPAIQVGQNIGDIYQSYHKDSILITCGTNRLLVTVKTDSNIPGNCVIFGESKVTKDCICNYEITFICTLRGTILDTRYDKLCHTKDKKSYGLPVD